MRRGVAWEHIEEEQYDKWKGTGAVKETGELKEKKEREWENGRGLAGLDWAGPVEEGKIRRGGVLAEVKGIRARGGRGAVGHIEEEASGGVVI